MRKGSEGWCERGEEREVQFRVNKMEDKEMKEQRD